MMLEEKQTLQDLIDGFIHTQSHSRKLDERTAKAYRLDLELYFRWLESAGERKTGEHKTGEKAGKAGEKEKNRAEEKIDRLLISGDVLPALEGGWEESMEEYLKYLSEEKGLRFSTVCRRHLVFGYFLGYLKGEGAIEEFRPLKPLVQIREEIADTLLTKDEVDAFFQAINREYTELDSDFRKRVCLRDQVMMELLFYHKIEISELLRMEVSDYNRKTAVLTIRRKREKSRSVYLFNRTLQRRMEEWLGEHEYFEHGDLYCSRMFLSKLGRPLSMKMVTNIFDKYRVLAGIEKGCTPKDLKNSLGRYAEEVVRGMG